MNDTFHSMIVLLGQQGIDFIPQPTFPAYWALFLWVNTNKPNLTVPPTWDAVMALLS